MKPFPARLLPCSWCLGIVCIAHQLAVTPGMSGPSPPISPSVVVERTSSLEKDDLGRLLSFENYIRQGKFQEVAPLLRNYLKNHPHSARAYYDLGYVLFRTHQIGASIEALAKSLELDINNAEAHKILGLDFTIIGKYDEAQIEMEQAVRLKPDSAEIHYFLGRTHYTTNAFPLAKREFEEATRLDPSYMKAYNNLALTMEAMGDDNAALANYEKAFLLNEQQGLKSEWPYVNVCALYNRQNKPEQALPYCQKATELNPQSDQAYFETARAHMSQQDWEQAAKALQNAIKINPHFARFHYVLGTVYRKLGKSEDGEKEMQVFRKLSEESRDRLIRQTADYPLRHSDNPADVKH
jgi:tetratricopeptide (TPR) repeat protein